MNSNSKIHTSDINTKLLPITTVVNPPLLPILLFFRTRMSTLHGSAFADPSNYITNYLVAFKARSSLQCSPELYVQPS